MYYEKPYALTMGGRGEAVWLQSSGEVLWTQARAAPSRKVASKDAGGRVEEAHFFLGAFLAVLFLVAFFATFGLVAFLALVAFFAVFGAMR